MFATEIEIEDTIVFAKAIIKQIEAIREAKTQKQVDDGIKQIENFQAEIAKQVNEWKS